jgi:hypothetical protein
MNDKFVQGSIAYEDNRTSRRTVKGSGSRSPLSSNGSPSSAVCQTNGPDTFFQDWILKVQKNILYYIFIAVDNLLQ